MGIGNSCESALAHFAPSGLEKGAAWAISPLSYGNGLTVSALMAQAKAELESLLTKRAFCALHLFRYLGNRSARFRMRAKSFDIVLSEGTASPLALHRLLYRPLGILCHSLLLNSDVALLHTID
jgi:hypothetical protein